jgi:hypothetical protein
MFPDPHSTKTDNHQGAIAYGVGHMNGTAGLSAWRWLFILEGLPSLLSAIAVFFLLPDYPETTSWLTEQDKKLAADRLRLEGSHGESAHMTWADAKATLLDLRLYAHYIVSDQPVTQPYHPTENRNLTYKNHSNRSTSASQPPSPPSPSSPPP